MNQLDTIKDIRISSAKDNIIWLKDHPEEAMALIYFLIGYGGLNE